MVKRMKITYDEIVDELDIKYIARSIIGYTLPPGNYGFSYLNLMLKFSFSERVKVNKKIVYIRIRSNLTTNKTIKFTKKSVFSIQ